MTAYLQHALGLIKQLLGFRPHILIVENLGVASVGVSPPQLPCLQDTVSFFSLLPHFKAEGSCHASAVAMLSEASYWEQGIRRGGGDTKHTDGTMLHDKQHTLSKMRLGLMLLSVSPI